MKNDSRKLNQFKTLYSTNLINNKKIAKITLKNKELYQENKLFEKMIRRLDYNLGKEKTKRHVLELMVDKKGWRLLHLCYLQNFKVNANKYQTIESIKQYQQPTKSEREIHKRP